MGCVMSGFLFFLALDWTMREATPDKRRGIQWNFPTLLDFADLDFADHIALLLSKIIGEVVVSWSVRSSPERVVWVQALFGDTKLCSWARHSTLIVPLSTQKYTWVSANCWENLTNRGGMTCDGLASRPGGVEILLAASCYRNLE